MTHFFLGVIVVLSFIIPCFIYRVVRGPAVFDRLIGLNGIAIKAVLFLVFIGAYKGDLAMFLDIALGYGLLNLVGAVAAGKYLERKGLQE